MKAGATSSSAYRHRLVAVSRWQLGSVLQIISVYGQDTWRVSDRLTLTLGLRYESHTPWVEDKNQQDNYNPETGHLKLPARGAPAVPSIKARTAEKTSSRASVSRVRPRDSTVTQWSVAPSRSQATWKELERIYRLPLNPPFDGGSPGSPNSRHSICFSRCRAQPRRTALSRLPKRSRLPGLLLLQRDRLPAVGSERATGA